MRKSVESEKLIALKGRPREIFLDLCAEIDCLPYGSVLPSVRELRRRYRASQATIAKALDYLGDYRELESTPRKRTYLSDPTMSRTSAPRPEVMGIKQHNSRTTTLGMPLNLRGCWEKYVIDYNRTHKSKIVVRYASTDEELKTLSVNTDIDFVLYHNRPILLDLVPDTSDFIDMRSLYAELNPADYYPGTFMNDLEGRLWGILPAQIISVLRCNRKFCPEYRQGLTWQEFHDELVRLKAMFPKLAFPGCLDGYMIYLFSRGVRLVDPETRRIQLEMAELAGPLEQLREMIDRQLIPLFSDEFYQGQGKALFHKNKAAIAQFHHGGRLQDCKSVDYFEIPMPWEPGIMQYSNAETFHICMHTLHYRHAWDFIKYVLSPDVQRRIVRHGDYPCAAHREVTAEFIQGWQYPLFNERLERTGDFIEDYLFSFRLRLILEAGIDHWIEFRKDLPSALDDIKRSYQKKR